MVWLRLVSSAAALGVLLSHALHQRLVLRRRHAAAIELGQRGADLLKHAGGAAESCAPIQHDFGS